MSIFRTSLAAAVLAGLGLAGLGSAQAGDRVEISLEDCRRATRYVEPEGVAFEPGKDVYGREVDPADLNGGTGQVELPEIIEFDVAFNPLSDLAISQGTRDFSNTSDSLGRVTFDTVTNRLTFNGETLSADTEADLIAQCREALQES